MRDSEKQPCFAPRRRELTYLLLKRAVAFHAMRDGSEFCSARTLSRLARSAKQGCFSESLISHTKPDSDADPAVAARTPDGDHGVAAADPPGSRRCVAADFSLRIPQVIIQIWYER